MDLGVSPNQKIMEDLLDNLVSILGRQKTIMLQQVKKWYMFPWIQVFSAMWVVMDDDLNVSNIRQVLMVIDNVTRIPLGHTRPLKNDT